MTRNRITITFETPVTYAIVGSRDFPALELVSLFIARHLPPNARVVTGDARGVDKTVIRLCESLNIVCEVCRAQWHYYGRGAGLKRNRDIISKADKVVVFWDGKSTGSEDDIELARAAQKPLLIIYPDGSTRRETYAYRQPQLF